MTNPTSTDTAAKDDLADRAQLIYGGLLTVLESYSSKGYLDTGAHDVLIGIARQAEELGPLIDAHDAKLKEESKALADKLRWCRNITQNGDVWFSHQVDEVIAALDTKTTKAEESIEK